MKCPFCGHDDTQVKDSRPSDDGKTIRRRRECEACGRRFTTFERFQVQQIVVLKKSGQRELFDREKLSQSISKALRKRPVSPQSLELMISDLEQQIAESGLSEVTSADIGLAVMRLLKKLDIVGFVRYASVYNDFKSAEDFRKILDDKGKVE